MENKNDSLMVNIIKSILPFEEVKKLNVTKEEDYNEIINNLNSITKSINQFTKDSFFSKLLFNNDTNPITKCIDDIKKIIDEKHNEGNKSENKQIEIVETSNLDKKKFPSDSSDNETKRNVNELVNEFIDLWKFKFPELENVNKYTLQAFLYEFGCWVSNK